MLEAHNSRRIFIFAKDLNGRFLFCNESHAEIAGLDSPSQIVGKTDKDLFWRKNAEHCQKGDKLVIGGQTWINVTENLLRRDGKFDILISKFRLFDENEACIGVVGSYFDIKKYKLDELSQLKNNFFAKKQKIQLGEAFNGKYLTLREYQVFKNLLMGCSIKEIAKNLNVCPKTAEYHLTQIKKKLGCTYKSEIILTAVKYGLVSLNF